MIPSRLGTWLRLTAGPGKRYLVGILCLEQLETYLEHLTPVSWVRADVHGRTKPHVKALYLWNTIWSYIALGRPKKEEHAPEK